MNPESSQTKRDSVIDDFKLDVHAISELKSKNIPSTDDSPKYDYRATTDSKDGAYEFDKCEAKVIVIRSGNKFVSEAKQGQQCCLILDRTCFYAEQGGQIYDQGLITSDSASESENHSEFFVEKVFIQVGYVLHIGKITNGIFSCGDRVTLNYDTKRRRLNMNNHTAIHILYCALCQVLGNECKHKTTLVTPDMFRLVYTYKSAMNIGQIRKIERMVQDVIKCNSVVYTKCCKLENARKIPGLEDTSGEVYPDPVRVVSVGLPVEKLENDPSSAIPLSTSIEFCGGTHVHRTGHIQEFLITSEKSIPKETGTRRIIAISGPDAQEALKRADVLNSVVEELIELEKSSNDSDTKTIMKKWLSLNNEISQSLISITSKDQLQSKLAELKKKIDAKEKNAQDAESSRILQLVTDLLDRVNDEHFLVDKLETRGNTKTMDIYLKQVVKLNKDLSVMFFTVDQSKGIICCSCVVSRFGIQCGLLGGNWIRSIVPVIKGKGGGNKQSGQASGSNFSAVDEAISIARRYASDHLRTVDDKPHVSSTTCSSISSNLS